MLNNLRQNNYQSQLENSLSNQVQQAFQSTVQFGIISFLLYVLMVLIVITLLISIVVANKYRQSQQLLLVGILLIPLLIVLFGCTLYILFQFSEAKERMNKIPQEKYLNRQMYQSSIKFLFFYTNQSKFTAIRLTYLYIVFAISILIQNLAFLSKDEYNDDEDYKDLDETNNNNNNNNDDTINYQTRTQNNGNLLFPLIILCSILAFIFFIYEILKIALTIYFKCRNQSIPPYQYNDTNLNILKVIRWSKAFCGIFLVNNIGKMMILCTIFITPNSTSYILIGSNLYYHFFMATLVNALFNEISAIQRPPQNDSSIFINHQILIDSKLKSMNTKKVFQFLLLTSFIFTIIGTCIFRIEMDTQNGIINFDIFIFYDCAITQLILLGLANLKYLIIPYFNKGNSNIIHQIQVIEDQQQQTIENQQIRLSTEQAQLEMILRSQNDDNYDNSRNRPPFKKVKNIDFIIQNENEKSDCIICLQPMIFNLDDPILQLNCHNTHIFHKKCITDWLIQNKKCPLCNTQIL
ncbi:unnamed protein product [Paramecium primaurelia]|uniref:RING-type domain-containing protein n=1 Tax=Paramecium primaurelia TaxID=5886 RepID=A0A8S1NAK5_PARPR|nr:unnamed protein product [Paramecium primaurelia]